ncbi:hypothetical protein DL766_000265 [Monosporascus sp. MC13-8B]|uniref:Uncharacterized protein n=1 Tax=Monosporascus cannonballus TaxID=155416 RepID=A0ABY0H1C9_9PEZI|nr:hypothetical protein DL763_008626 [Monosporascus cannonballus]RYO81559.1 hypothetical protein DL762_007050 [Monosporascus cannonballus]RYP39823.1 hypothetical protein DL766_000265 [Monosporascus sp. MC13-8B]
MDTAQPAPAVPPAVPPAHSAAAENGDTDTSIEKVQQYLKAKDDTSRFVGLALLKSVLDNSPALQSDEETITSLWNSISPKFLDRLLRTGSRAGPDQKNSKDMLDLPVAVLHTFTVLLPDEAKQGARLLNRIPRLTSAVLYSFPEGASIFAGLDIDEWTPLIEIAPEHPHVLSIFIWAWERGTTALADQQSRSDAELIPQNPKWLRSVAKFIRNLSTKRPTAAGRSAYTRCAGTVLMLYPRQAPQLLFSDEQDSEKPFSYLFINLILVDVRATLPSLLEKLNDAEYPQTSQRLAAALDVLAAFIGHLIAWIEELDSPDAATPPSEKPTFNMPPHLVLKLSKSIGETISVTMEYLRDRWDASVAGAAGLHPEARVGAAHTSTGSHKTLAWDSKDGDAAVDPFTLSALRAIALWLRDDDGDVLRKEAAGLMDMLMELYQRSSSTTTPPSASSSRDQPDYRLPTLAALEGILRTSRGVEAFDSHGGWQVLSRDLVAVLNATSSNRPHDLEAEILRGTRIALALSIVVESETTTPEDRMGLVTAVAAYDVPPIASASAEGAAAIDNGEEAALLGFQTDVLRLAAALLANANPGMRRRYAHSASAIRDIAERLRSSVGSDESPAASDLDDVLAALSWG